MNTKKLFTALIATGFIAACADSTSTGKGEEDNPLTDGKADSFRKPTEHGTLRMDEVRNDASMNEEEQFHAWTFELSGDAKIDLRTEISKNLDTVMYLYHRDSPDDSWGRFKRKNDDDDGQLSSRIVHEAGAGEWRVIVKGFKQSLRGSFSVLATCDGDGCNTGDGECSADTFETLPRSTNMTDECAFDIAGVLVGEPISETSSEIGISKKCSLVGLERTAIDFYHEFWEEFVDFEDQFQFDPDEDIFLNFSTTEYPNGSEITVDAGGDEDALSMLFDKEGRLLAAYQHNQSPTVEFYCGDRGTEIEFVDESCYEDIREHLPRFDEKDREFGEISASDTSGHEGVLVAVQRFVDQAGFDQDEVISFELIEYDGGIAVNFIGPDDISAEYTAFNGFDGWEVIMEADANGVSFVCE